MLMPQELKKRSFSHSLRGYTTADVDDYIDFLIDKYSDLYRENDELERKLAAALSALDELKAREKKILALDSEVRRAAAGILRDAEAEKKQIIADAHEFADQLIANADAHVAAQEDVFHRMQDAVCGFRDTLFSHYSTHIDDLEALANLSLEQSYHDPLPAKKNDEPILPALSELGLMESSAAESEETDDAEANWMDEEAVPAAETPAEEVVSDTDDSIEFEPDIASEEDTFEDLFGDLPKIDNGIPNLTDEPEADLSVLFDDSDMQEIVPLFPTDALETATPNPEEEEEDIFPAPDPDAFDIPEGTDDEALLNELRQAFHIEFDTTVVGSDDTDEFTFLSNNDESAKDGTHDRHGDAEEEDV